MSKRNFILLIIVLVIATSVTLGFLYFRQPTKPAEENGGTNFISQFNPFGNNTTTPPSVKPPANVSGYQPGGEQETLKLKKISSMPIAGFTLFSKERLKEVVATPPQPLPEGEGQKEGAGSGDSISPLLMEEGVGGGKRSSLTSTLPQGKGVKPTTKPAPPLTEFMPALRYVERATGNIYQTFADKIEERKFSTTIIPMVYEALFGNNGQSVIMRYLKGETIITFVGNLPKEFLGADTTASNEIKGTFLPENIKDISLSGDASSIFYLFSSGNNLEDNIIGTTLNLINNKKVQVFDSPFTEWLSLFPNNKMLSFTTKPSAGIPGYMYAIDPNNKNYNFNKILGNINGLTTLTNPNGKLVLYGNDNLSLSVYHTDTKVSDTLGIRTLPEKCVWNKIGDAVYCGVPKFIGNGQYPDSWYQGEVSFGDQIWKIDIKTGNAKIVADPATVNGGEEIDSIKLLMDDGENYLFFVNKKDSFLWELSLK